jgi:hypothetical protein
VKAIKIIGLAALTALLAMAFVGASSAMAEPTALCKADQNPCEEKNVVSHVHETSVGKAKLLSSVGTTECNVLFLGDAASAMAAGAGLGVVGGFTYTNCELGGSACTAKEENGPAEIQVLRTGHETATVTGEGLVHLVCSGFIDCSYNGTGLSGTAKGPLLSTQKNGEVSLSEQTTNKETGGFLCPKTAKLDITTTPLEATYVSTPAFDYCVEFEHENSGFYLSHENGECIEPDAAREGEYELVESTRAFALEEMICVRLRNNVGLWKYYKVGSNLTECEVDLIGGNVGRYELGWVL